MATVPAQQRSVGSFGARRDGVVAGLAVAAATIDAVCGDEASDFEYLVADGVRVGPGEAVARVTAPTRGLLTAERTALNLLCHLSGVATLTRRWADALEGTRVRRPRHAQDDARSAGAREVRRALRRWRQPPHGALRRRAGQGQPRAGGRRRGTRRSTPCDPSLERCRSRSRSTRSTGCASPSTPASTPCCSTTSRSTVARGGGDPRRIRPPRGAGGEWRAHAGGRSAGGGDRCRLRRRRRAHPLRSHPRPRSGPECGDLKADKPGERYCSRRVRASTTSLDAASLYLDLLKRSIDRGALGKQRRRPRFLPSQPAWPAPARRYSGWDVRSQKSDSSSCAQATVRSSDPRDRRGDWPARADSMIGIEKDGEHSLLRRDCPGRWPSRGTSSKRAYGEVARRSSCVGSSRPTESRIGALWAADSFEGRPRARPHYRYPADYRRSAFRFMIWSSASASNKVNTQLPSLRAARR